jgi:hypothetical protein
MWQKMCHHAPQSEPESDTSLAPSPVAPPPTSIVLDVESTPAVPLILSFTVYDPGVAHVCVTVFPDVEPEPPWIVQVYVDALVEHDPSKVTVVLTSGEAGEYVKHAASGPAEPPGQ